MKTALCVCMLLAAVGTALAQSDTQLQAFAGSRVNFERLVQGLQTGRQVELASIAPDGVREAVTFQGARPLSAEETDRLLHTARATLASHGIESPGAWDIGIALFGGTLVTPAGRVQLPRLVAPADPQRPLVIHLHTFAGSPANYRSLMRGLTQGTPVTLASADGGGKIRFQPPGRPLSRQEASDSLLAAGELLAGQGVDDPRPEQLRAAVVSVLEARLKAKP